MAIDERAQHRKMLMGDAAPNSDGSTTYIQVRRYNRQTKKIESVPGLSATAYDYEPEEVFVVIRDALIAHTDKLKREAQTNDQTEEERRGDRNGAGDGAEPERPAGGAPGDGRDGGRHAD
jgi:hypothetical protein